MNVVHVFTHLKNTLNIELVSQRKTNASKGPRISKLWRWSFVKLVV